MTRFDSVTLEVQDLVRSLAFYRLLGLSIPEQLCTPRYACTSTADGGRLEWVVGQRVSTRRRLSDPCGHGVVPVIRCSSPAEVDAIVLAAAGAGHHVEAAPADTAWGARSAQVVDPDGYVVRVFAPYP